jgi:GT2 family glycosyltransferase
MTASPLVYIIILNWNGWQDTIKCIESCLKLAYPRYRILIVDNDSTDGSMEKLHLRFPDIDILQTGSNLGFAGGNNVGIRHAIEQGADYVWLLNNDTIVDPSALVELVNVAKERDSVGIVGSKIYFYSQPDVIWFAGGLIRKLRGTSIHRGHREKDEGQYNKISEVDYITGCSLLIKREVVAKVGLMDERFFLLFEEVDWNQRVKEQGYGILYVPFSKVWHKVSMSIGADSPAYFYYLIRNSLLFTLKHKPIYIPTVTLGKLMDISYLLFHKRFAVARGALMGLFDFYRFHFGQLGNRSQ